MKVNILETTRIAHFLGAKLILLHVGEETSEKINQINVILSEIEYPNLPIEIQWKKGNPEKIILETCSSSNIDLLILGALQHENMFQFYVGSIARKLTRKVVEPQYYDYSRGSTTCLAAQKSHFIKKNIISKNN